MFSETPGANPVIEIETPIPRLDGWRDRIAAARKRGKFSPEDRADAGGWEHCAIGEARQRYPEQVDYCAADPWTSMTMRRARRTTGGLDPYLYFCGRRFGQAVYDNAIDRAEKIVYQIEHRIAALREGRPPAAAVKTIREGCP